MKIESNKTLVSVHDKNGREIPFYDDCDGNLYIHYQPCGNFYFPAAVVRARGFEKAWEIVCDEFLPEAEISIAELRKEYGFRRKHVRIMRDAEGREFIPDSFPLPDSAEFVRWKTTEVSEPDAWPENEVFLESYTFRPSGPRFGDVWRHGIAELDVNGISLRRVTESDELKIEFLTEEE
jgi:hypothetical protein